MMARLFATLIHRVCNFPSPTLTVVETSKLTPELIDALNERGAMRVTVPSR
jgi:hypothetical protein